MFRLLRLFWRLCRWIWARLGDWELAKDVAADFDDYGWLKGAMTAAIAVFVVVVGLIERLTLVEVFVLCLAAIAFSLAAIHYGRQLFGYTTSRGKLVLPKKHPKVDPIRIESQKKGWPGLVFSNPGWPAINVVLEPFTIGAYVVRFENGDIPRLTKHDGEVRREFTVHGPNSDNVISSDLFDAFKSRHRQGMDDESWAAQEATITYEDTNGIKYETQYRYEVNVHTKGGVDVRFIGRRRIA